MIKMLKRTRIEIVVDAALVRRIRDIAAAAGTVGFTITPIIGGADMHGRWVEDHVTGGAANKVVFATIVDADAAPQVIEALGPAMDDYGLTITTSQIEVVDPLSVEVGN